MPSPQEQKKSQAMTPPKALEYAMNLESGKQLAAAEKVYRDIISQHPGFHPAYHRLGLLAFQVKKLDIAIELIGSALAIDDQHPVYHRDRGEMLRMLGRLDEAIAEARWAVSINNKDAESHYNLAIALSDNESFETAIKHYRLAVAINPKHGMAWNNMGTAFEKLEQREQAEKCYSRAVELNPNHTEALANLGKILSELGKMTEARQCLEKVLALKPNSIGALHTLSTIKKFTADSPELATMEALAKQAGKGLNQEDRIRLLFSLGKARDDAGQYDTAFIAFNQGNTLKQTLSPVDEPALITQANGIVKHFNQTLFSQHQDSGEQDDSPLFIVGMPRSGTTLTEQILASHPQVFGGGELRALNDAVIKYHQADTLLDFSEAISALPTSSYKNIGKHYIKHIRKLSKNARFITDKMPANFFYIGMIHLALPNARIIHTLRDPMDICLSCYTRLFNSSMEFTYSLETLGRYYNRYIETMEHWQKVLPNKVLTIRYEDTVLNQQQQTEKLLDFAGLPWDDRCLDFHRNDRRIRTASVAQVRKPMYTSSMGGWKRYEKQLQPLMDIVKHHRSRYYD